MSTCTSLLRLLPLFLPFAGQAAVINGYAQITAISGSVLTVGTVDETGGQFTAGKSVILLQMQDDVIGTNTNNDAAFGNIADLKQAGRFVVRDIISVTRNGSNVLTSITVNSLPDGTFNIGANSSLQAVTYELLGGGGDFATTADLTALDWNGSIGGVVAVRVNGALTLRNTISADGAGFRGGARTTGGGAGCDANTYITSSSATAYAGKGEGIQKLTNAAWANGRGKVANGGGGGNSHNAGGGGGGGHTAGGTGGPGYTCSNSAGGLGGMALGPYAAGDRLFLGGGGGGGEGNNSTSTVGGRGGGIVIVKAGSIVTSGTYGSLRISADGVNGANSGNDGAGGGGAGGSVMLQVPTYTVAATAPLAIRANGGAGGTVSNALAHGGGGGGAQGTVIYSSLLPTTNITTHTDNGTPGCSNNSVPCNSSAGAASGTDEDGIRQSWIGVLPIELLYFYALPLEDRVELHWATASESGNERFTIERSTDVLHWTKVAEEPGAINSMAVLYYTAADEAPVIGLAYYRLKQTDLDGDVTYSDLVPVRMGAGKMQLSVSPNPASSIIDIRVAGGGQGRVEVVNSLGQRTGLGGFLENGRCTIGLSSLPAGPYIAMSIGEGVVLQQRFLVRH